MYRLPFRSYYYFRFTTVTIAFRFCGRSRDVGHTSIASVDLENVCIVFENLHLSFIVAELLLLPVGGGHILLPCEFRCRQKSHNIGRHLQCIGCPEYMNLNFALYNTDADGGRTKIVCPMFHKLAGANVKYTMHQNVGTSTSANEKPDGKYEAIFELRRRVWWVGTDPLGLIRVRQKHWSDEG